MYRNNKLFPPHCSNFLRYIVSIVSGYSEEPIASVFKVDMSSPGT
jgi:hypothetical protein